ncbi:hypothetical protein N9L68_08965 [bacterium]|nr:hypothetical protein [bacterium]
MSLTLSLELPSLCCRRRARGPLPMPEPEPVPVPQPEPGPVPEPPWRDASADQDAEGAGASASARASASAGPNASTDASASAAAIPIHVGRDDPTVYRTLKCKGHRFHAKEGCSHATVPLTLRQARARSLTACDKCCARERRYVD